MQVCCYLLLGMGPRYRLMNDCLEGVPDRDMLDALLAIIKAPLWLIYLRPPPPPRLPAELMF